MSFLKSALLELCKEFLYWISISLSGKEAKLHNCHQALPGIPIGLGKFLKFSRSPKCVQVLSLSSLRKATFTPYLERLPWTIWISKVPGNLSKGLLLVVKVNLNPIKLFADIQVVGISLWNMTFQSTSWLIKPQLVTGYMCLVMKKLDSSSIYVNTLP